MIRLLLAVPVLLFACVTTHSRAATALNCPEESVVRDEPTAEEFALQSLRAATTVSAPLLATLPPRTEARDSVWRGCGHAVQCSTESCSELASSKADRLAAIVPTLMERSRADLAPDSTTERTGTYSWQLVAGDPLYACRLVRNGKYRCDSTTPPMQP